MSEPTPGRYRHYKGKEYSVLGVARHSETLEELVVYRQEYGDHGLWVRPKPMFLESVQAGAKEVPRFEYLGAESADEQPQIRNIFAEISGPLPEELCSTLLQAANVRIERIVSYGQASPEGFWYDQDQHEWVIVLRGAARLRFEDRLVEMGPGNYINIPAHRKHRVEWTASEEPTVWLAVHYGP